MAADLRDRAVGRRQSRHLVGSDECRPLRPDERSQRPHDVDAWAGLAADGACRSPRPITSRSTIRRRTGSTRTGRTTARCAGRARIRSSRSAIGRGNRVASRRRSMAAVGLPFGRRGGRGEEAWRSRCGRPLNGRPEQHRRAGAEAGRGGGADSNARDRRRWRRWRRSGGGSAAPTMGTSTRRMRIRIHASRSEQHRHRLGELLRQHGDAMGRQVERRALGVPVDAHARLAARPAQVPLSLDAAARHRSVRSQHGLLRMPGDLQDVEPRPELDGDQSRSLDEGSVAHRLVGWAHSATTSASSTARSCSRSRRREIQRGLIWAGTNDGQVWYTRDGGATGTNVTKTMHRLPAWGTIRKIEPSHFDPAHGVRRGRLSHDGRPRAVRLEDDGLRQDVDERHRRSAGDAARSTT